MAFERGGVTYPTYGAYLRAKNLKIDTGLDGRKAWDAEIDAFKEARRQGVMPAGTKMHQIRSAMEVSEKVGKAFDATDGSFK